jgi:transposase
VLAQLYASGFLPEVWIADEPTQALRRQVTRRNQVVRQRSRLKNIVQSILHAHLVPSCPHADLCGGKGRAWLNGQVVPEDERLAIDRHLREFDRLGEDLQVIERDLARVALADDGVKRLMTIPGIAMIVALVMKAAIGEVSRFDEPQKLVSYLGLNPSVRQSGPGPAYHGRITKQGQGMRAACSSKRPGRPHARLDRCAPSSCVCVPDAASMSLPLQPRASLPS